MQATQTQRAFETTMMPSEALQDVVMPITSRSAIALRVAQPVMTSVAGTHPIEISAAAIEATWTLRFGMFGCPDSETRGGVVHVKDGQLLGGDSTFAYHGQWTLRGTELTASLDIVRHGIDRNATTVFGTDESEYHIDCVAEVMMPDLIEGRLLRPGFPDARLTMRRLAAPAI
jgi:hypothetical protein